MSKQGTLLDLGPLTDWAAVYAAASETDRRIVDFVQGNPGALKRDIATALGLNPKSLDFRLWELSGRSTGGHGADGLLLATLSGPPGNPYYRYTARERA